MNWLVMAVGLLALWRSIGWLSRLARRRTWSVSAPALRRRPCRHRRLGDARRRRLAAKQARELATMLASGWSHHAVAHLCDGVVLGAGEVPLQCSATHFWVCATRSTWVSRTGCAVGAAALSPVRARSASRAGRTMVRSPGWPSSPGYAGGQKTERCCPSGGRVWTRSKWTSTGTRSCSVPTTGAHRS